MSLKHVIFLGAGASCGSGYPSANGLRLRVSSSQQVQDDLIAAFSKRDDLASQNQRVAVESFARGAGFTNFLLRFADTFSIFRYGGFGSVDELSKLASLTFPEHVQQMKRLMEVALSLHNPEDKFQDSEYYSFVQNLFDKDLVTLKNNITVVSYNYDCYLEFLLLRAQEQRYKLSKRDSFDVHEKNRLSSGFYEPKDLIGLSSPSKHFKYLKLHGSISYANDVELRRLFTEKLSDRFGHFDQHVKPHSPPVVFPWELFDASGKFIQKDDFIAVKEGISTQFRPDYLQAELLYKLYKVIWAEARDAIQKAEKISFVGMSMHDFLMHGLRFLFNGKSGSIEVVVANTAKEKERICLKVGRMLRSVAPDVKFTGSKDIAFIDERDSNGRLAQSAQGITPRDSFADFIEKEMD